MALKIGEMLLNAGVITQEQLDEALEMQKANGSKVGANLIQLGYVKEEEITALLSKQYGIPSVNLTQFDEIDSEVLKLVPSEVAQKYLVFPLNRTGANLTLAMADPTNYFAMDDIKFITGYNIEPLVASEMAIREAIDRHYGSASDLELKEIMDEAATEGRVGSGVDAELETVEEEEGVDVHTLEAQAEEAPVVKLVNLIITEALKKEASDIHIEPYEADFRVRYRIDGVLFEVMKPPMKLKDAITSRVKIMAKLDISEKRLPQDGRMKLKIKLEDRFKELDFRVSVLPVLHGEKIVMRLLDPDKLFFDMTKLGMEQESLDKFIEAITQPYGMCLVTGPTGSGKTNTLYSAMHRLNNEDTNIVTAEDPVEFNIHGINQVQMKDQIGLNFAAALRSFLRQDPDIILVGEVRDFETAEIAVKAALTGHLVLSTVHTNDAPGTISRLMNMGIEPFLVATSVNVVVAQRLVRVVCKECKEVVKTPPQALIDIGYTPEEAKSVEPVEGKGCAMCNNTGFKGRIGLFEVMPLTDDMKELILSGASALEIRDKAKEEGMINLRYSGLAKIKSQVTSISEVVRDTVLF